MEPSPAVGWQIEDRHLTLWATKGNRMVLSTKKEFLCGEFEISFDLLLKDIGDGFLRLEYGNIWHLNLSGEISWYMSRKEFWGRKFCRFISSNRWYRFFIKNSSYFTSLKIVDLKDGAIIFDTDFEVAPIYGKAPLKLHLQVWGDKVNTICIDNFAWTKEIEDEVEILDKGYKIIESMLNYEKLQGWG